MTKKETIHEVKIVYLNYEIVDGWANFRYQFPWEWFINARQHRAKATVERVLFKVLKSKACIIRKTAYTVTERRDTWKCSIWFNDFIPFL